MYKRDRGGLRFFDGCADEAAPLGPGAVVVAYTWVAEQLGQHEPGVGRALADAAVGNDIFVGSDVFAFVNLAQLFSGFEGAIAIGGCGPGNVLRAWDMTTALGALLGIV